MAGADQLIHANNSNHIERLRVHTIDPSIAAP